MSWLEQLKNEPKRWGKEEGREEKEERGERGGENQREWASESRHTLVQCSMSYRLKWMCCLGCTLCSHDQEGSASKCIEVVGRIHFLFAIEFIVVCFFKVNNWNQRKRGGKKHRKETMGGDWYFTIGNKLQVLLANGTGYDSLWGHLSYVHHKWPVCFEYRWRKQLLFKEELMLLGWRLKDGMICI